MKNIESKNLTVNVDRVGIHRTREFMKLYDIQHPFIERQTFPNTCACNEYSAMIGRHMIPTEPGYDPKNPVLQGLRKSILSLANNIRHSWDEVKKAGHSAVMDHTRSSIKKRYQNAYDNKIKRTMHGSEVSSTISAFVKYETTNYENSLVKPPRLIQFRSYEYLYDLKSFLFQFDSIVKENDIIMSNGQRLKDSWTKYNTDDVNMENMLNAWNEFDDPVGLCLDHSKFDGHYQEELLEIEHAFWNCLFNNKYLAELLEKQMNNQGWTSNGIKFRVRGKRASGEYTTSGGNTLLNWHMIAEFLNYCGVLKYFIFVNGDDSVIIINRSDLEKLGDLSSGVKFMINFNMKCEVEMVAEKFNNIVYCQRSPCKLQGVWRWIKNPWRTLARFSVCASKYLKCADRYLAGKSLCELFMSRGVPILQAMCLRGLHDSVDSKPLGSVDKVPAQNFANNATLGISQITLEDRMNFEDTFGVTIQQQEEIENAMTGDLPKNPIWQRVLEYIEKYKFFIYN